MLKKILTGLVLVVAAGGAGFYFLANREIRGRVDTVMETAVASGIYDDLDYRELQVEMNGDIRLSGVRVVERGGIPYLIDEALITDYDLAHDIPHFMTIRASGISFPEGLPQVEAFQNSALSAYVDRLMVDGVVPATLDSRYTYDPDNNDELTGSMAFDLPGAMAGSFDSTVRGLPLEQMFMTDIGDPRQAQAAMLAYLGTMEIPSARISLTDLGMVEELIAIGAQTNGMAAADFREQLRVQAQSLYFLAPQSLQEFAVNAGDQLATFIDGDARLDISISPEYEGDMQRLQTEVMGAVLNQNFGVIPDLLNLEISAQPEP